MLTREDRGARPVRGDPAQDPETARRAAAEEAEEAIVCAACGHTVTFARHRISVQGSHEHRFMNPAGFLYHIGCFAEAPGAAPWGPESLEYPWFAGFAWRIAHCGGCGVQLGWAFRSAEGIAFFGLILDRLRQGG